MTTNGKTFAGLGLEIQPANVINIIREYERYKELILKGSKWKDNGLRVCSKKVGIPKDYKEKGLALENELGRVLSKIGLDYSLQVPIGDYQIADAIVRINNGLCLRIED